MTDSEDLVSRIAEMPGCADTKRRIIEVLRSMAGRRVWLSKRALIRSRQMQLATQLLYVERMTTIEAGETLMHRLNISRRTAQRLMKDALRSRTAGAGNASAAV